MRTAASVVLLAIAVLLACTVPAAASQRCSRCGCCEGVHKYCRLVCEEKEVKRTCYSSVAEDFCVPDRSIPCGEACDGCEHFTIWQPTCARVRTRHKLVKREIVTRRPSWKWVVEDLCGNCCHELAQGDLPIAVPPARAGQATTAVVPANHQSAPSAMPAARKRLLPHLLLDP